MDTALASARRAGAVDVPDVWTAGARSYRPMKLLVNALKNAIDDLAKKKGLENYRVAYKVNTRGEIVIALILPAERDPIPPTREEIKRSRER
jgi:hypothetical protein